LWQSEKLGLNRFVSEQPPYNILDRRAERELFPFCQTFGFGTIPWSPIAGGMLTGKYRRSEKAPEGSRYESGVFRSGEPVSNTVWDVVEDVEALAREKGCAMDAFALAWTMAHPAVSSPIIGPRTMEQFQNNLAALEVTVTEEDKARIDALVQPGTHVASYYQSDFGPSQHR
jgi:aryl-alcohol dehydrogenase-like predicted oxidoreductase